MAKFIVTMKHYDDFSGLVKDSITANDFDTAKKVFNKWVENDKNDWNGNCMEELTIKETNKTYMATLYNDFGLEYTKITITEKKEKAPKKIIDWLADNDNNGEITCECGNDEFSCGFVACDQNGNEIDPTKENNWDRLYLCCKCGKIYRDITNWNEEE